MRRAILVSLTALAAGGCSTPILTGRDDGIPRDSIRKYARAHDLSYDLAKRELSLARDAESLKELRQVQPPQTEGVSAQVAPLNGP